MVVREDMGLYDDLQGVRDDTNGAGGGGCLFRETLTRSVR